VRWRGEPAKVGPSSVKQEVDVKKLLLLLVLVALGAVIAKKVPKPERSRPEQSACVR